MSFMIDTSVILEHGLSDVSDWAVSVVTLGEIQAGVLLAPDQAERARRLRVLTALLEEGQTVDVDEQAAAKYPFKPEVMQRYFHPDGGVADW